MKPVRPRPILLPLLCALSIGAGIAGVSWGLQARREAAVLRAARAEADADRPRPVEIDIARLVRSLKLITVEIDSSVRSQVVHESWRGDVAAAVDTPVRYYYGTDLGVLGAEAVRRNPLTGAVEVRIPPARRLAVEVFSGDERTSVDVGWARLRDRAGEYYLGRARAAMHEQARAAPLRPEDAAEVERRTREQVEALVRSVLGAGVPVRVTIDERARATGGFAAGEEGE